MNILGKGLSDQITLLTFCLALGISGCGTTTPDSAATPEPTTPPETSEPITANAIRCSIVTPERRGTALYQFKFDAQGMPQPDEDRIIRPLAHLEVTDGTKVELVGEKPELALPKEKLPSNIPVDAFDENGQFVTQLVVVIDGPNSHQTGWANSQYLSCP